MGRLERASVNPTYSLRMLGNQTAGMPARLAASPSPGSPLHASEVAIIERLLDRSTLGRTFAVSLLIAMAISPFLKGILAGLAIIGAAGAVRTVLGM